jgi:hypothetical protein
LDRQAQPYPNPEALTAAVKEAVKARLAAALAEAKEGMDCGMTQAAVMSFQLDMMLCGTGAAKSLTVPDAARKERKE